MKNKKSIFIISKETDKESTGEISFEKKNDIKYKEPKYLFPDFCFPIRHYDDFNFKSDELSLSHELFSNEDLNFSYQNIDSIDLKKNNDFSCLFFNNDNTNEIPFKKNRNNLNNNLINEEVKDIEENNTIISNKKDNRSDSLLIKFKSSLGKWFINSINDKIKILKSNSVIKRSIKFYAFNYKKFTLKVSYNQNKEWLKDKMKDLLLLGDEDNQIKNKKSITSLYKKDLVQFKEIKDMLESTYENTIKEFYKSDAFDKFRKNKRVKELNYSFSKIMDISLLEKNGFVEFIEKRKGNTKKEK